MQKTKQVQLHGLTPEERFNHRVKKTGWCWEWQGGKTTAGYPVMSIGNKPAYAHRFSYETYVGPISDGLSVLHRCDNPGCVNPTHLFVGTRTDNAADKCAKGRQFLNLVRGEDSKRAKLTEAQVREIRAAEGTSRALAKRYGISQAQVSVIKRRKSWAHIPD